MDRGALDPALAAGFPCGGWCPEHRQAEDGVIPKTYPVEPLQGAGYRQRTRMNVVDSDGTVIFAPGVLTGGTALTQRSCEQWDKPCLVVDAAITSVEAAVRETLAFIEEHRIGVLNVAGPRGSG